MRLLHILILTCLLPSLALAASSDELTTELNDIDITYTYSSGDSYNVRYTAAGVQYRYLSGESPEKWWGPFPYKAFKTPNGEYFLGWYEKAYGDYITQLVNLKTRTLYGSGLIVKKDRTIEHFQRATIEKITMP